MPKINPLQKFDSNETDLKHLQVVYLNEHHFSIEEISKWTGYVVATVKRYIKKFFYLVEQAKKVFAHISKKAKFALRGGKREIVYLFKFYDEDNKILFSKVGTTVRLPEDRLKEELRSYRKKFPIDHAEICSTIDCGNIPAEGAESITRGLFIQEYPKAFIKNDRFLGIDLSTSTFNRIVKSYLSGATLEKKVAPTS